MNITQLQSILAPVLAPVAPAVLFGNNLYHGLVADGVDKTFAMIASVSGTIGVEISGALACSMAVMAYHKRDYKIMFISIAASLTYAIFVFTGIASAENSGAFAGAVIISLIAYLMLGVYQSYSYKLTVAQAETALKVAEIDAQRKLTNAETRKAKAGKSVQAVSTLSTGQNGQDVLDPQILELARAFFVSQPGASARDWLRDPNCPIKSPTTASKYKAAL